MPPTILSIETLLAMQLGTILAAAGAAFFGSYLAEKGKNTATREDIDRLERVQEEMKAQISGALWLSQERWRLKADVYSRLLTALADQGAVMAWFDHWETAHADEATAGGDVTKLPAKVRQKLRRLEKLAQEISRAQSVARLWLRPDAVEAIDKMRWALRDKGDAFDWSDGGVMVERAEYLVAEAARDDLQLDLRVGPR